MSTQETLTLVRKLEEENERLRRQNCKILFGSANAYNSAENDEQRRKVARDVWGVEIDVDEEEDMEDEGA